MLDELNPDAARAVRAYLRAVIFAEPLQLTLLAHYGIRLSELRALRLLHDRGPVPISQFAEVLGISRSTATGLVDRLEARDLVRREPGPTDRRTIHVAVTSRALAALEDRALVWDSALAHRIAALAPEEQRQLADLLARITDEDAAHLDPTTAATHETQDTR